MGRLDKSVKDRDTQAAMPPPTLAPMPTITPLAKVVVTSFAHVPLTTMFSPPGECFGVSSDNVYLIDQQTSCLPSGWSPAETAFFSPGLICPNGYSAACHDTGGVSTITTVTCCPERGNVTLQCVAEPTKLPSSLSNYMCQWEAPATGFPTTVTRSPNGKTITTSETLQSPDVIHAYGVRMVYQSSDKLISDTASMTDTPSGSSGTSAATSAKTTASASPSSSAGFDPSNPTISTTAVVIIAVCITVVICAILASLFLWWRRCSQPQPTSNSSPDAPSSNAPAPSTPALKDPGAHSLPSNAPAQVAPQSSVSVSDRLPHASMQSSLWHPMPPSPPPLGPLPYTISKSVLDHQDDAEKINRHTEISSFSASDTTTAFNINNAVELPVRSSASELPTPR